MSVDRELLALRVRSPEVATEGLFGTLTCISPLTITVRGTKLTEGLFYPNGPVFRKEDIGREVALLLCEEGFWILGFVGGGGA